MKLFVDHVVHVVHEPAAARRTFESAIGLQTLMGGRHLEWGTFNALSYFDLSYLEWVGVFDHEIASGSEFGRWVMDDLKRGEGVSWFALRTTEMDRIASDWAAHDLPFHGPIQGTRQRADGSIIRWRLLFPTRPDAFQFPQPFLIEWATSDEDRHRDLVQTRALPTNGQSCFQLAAIHCMVQSPVNTWSRWNSYFSRASNVDLLEQEDGHFSLQLGEVLVHFWAPHTERLTQQLEVTGERPFQVDIIRRGLATEEVEALTLHGLHIHVR
jgi:hypothetical protein